MPKNYLKLLYFAIVHSLYFCLMIILHMLTNKKNAKK